MKYVRALLALLVFGLALAFGVSYNTQLGLAGLGGTHWKEEVLLHDGRVLLIERRTISRGGHEIGQRAPIGDQSVTFTLPGTEQRVIWTDEYSKDIGSASFLLMALDIVDGIPYLVADPMGCLSYNKWGRPNPPYVIFKYTQAQWQRIPLAELPAEIKQPNLLQSTPDDVAKQRGRGGVVSVAVVQDERKGYKQPEFKAILREAMPISPCPQYSSSPTAPLVVVPKRP